MRNKTPLIVAVVVATLLMGARPAPAQQRPSWTQRLASLRLGWGRDEQDQEQRPQPQSPTVERRSGSAATPGGQAGAVEAPRRSGLLSALPRVNPQKLIPEEPFGPDRTPSTGPAVGATNPNNFSAAARRQSQTASGSAQARLLREMRAPAESPSARVPSASAPIATPPAARESATPPLQGRAGSALSGGPSPTNRAAGGGASPATKPDASVTSGGGVAPSGRLRASMSASQLQRDLIGPGVNRPLAGSSNRSALAKSIAADVAGALAEEPAKEKAPQAGARMPVSAETGPPKPTATAEAKRPAPSGDRYAASPVREEPRIELTVDGGARPGRGDAPSSDAARGFMTTADANTLNNLADAAERGGGSQLLRRPQAPLIESSVAGPRTLVLGRPATFRVLVANRGDAPAEGLVLRIVAPAWAEVTSASPSAGLAQPAGAGGAGAIVWKIERLSERETHELDLTLIAREGKPIELAVDWSHAPVTTRTVVQVEEPRLAVQLNGPGEVLYGATQPYRLTISNPGTGVAEHVRLRLTPPGENALASTHELGELKPGASRTVQVELTARQAGELAILAEAEADGGVTARMSKRLMCRKAELRVDWRGPKQVYSGAPGVYYFRLQNPGTAPASGVEFGVDLPEGFELTGATQGKRYDAARRRVAWTVGELQPGDDYYLEVRGVPTRGGENHLTATAESADGLVSHRAEAITDVVAVADLRLQVSDPSGPTPVGTPVTYEVRITNRGASAASNVKVVAMFSRGIEPREVVGAEAQMADGRVALRAIDQIPIGGEVVVQIRAVATQPGAHMFRAEVLCSDLETKLAADETTRFYAAEPVELSRGGGFGATR